MDSYTILCTGLRELAQSLNDSIDGLQEKAEKLQKAINKATRGDYKASDLSSAYAAQKSLTGGITRLGEICGAMNTAAIQFSEASAELSGRANLTAYYMQHTDTLSYEGLMGAYSSAILSAGCAAAGYELVKNALSDKGYSVGSLGSVSNAVQDAIQKEAEERAKREEEAKWAKIGLTGLVIVGGIAASFVTGGAAAPIVIGAISGAVMAGGNTAIDEYAEHGWETDKWDYAEIGKDVFVGGVTGAATAWIGGNLTKGFTNALTKSPVSALLKSSNAYVRVGSGAVIGSVSEVISGVGSRGTGAFITTMIETDGNLGKSLSDAANYAFDRKEILQDAVLGGVQGGKQQHKEWKLDNAGNKTAEMELIAKQANSELEIRRVPPNEYEDFAPGVSMVKREGRADIYAAGEHYDEYIKFDESHDYRYVAHDEPTITFVKARDIEGVNIGQYEVENGKFWNNTTGGSREAILDQASKLPEVKAQLAQGKTLDEIANDPNLTETIKSFFKSDPIVVDKIGDFFEHAGDGRHRTIAGQSMDVEIPVIIKGEWVKR